MKPHKEESKAAVRKRQGQHVVKMAKLHAIMIELKAKVEAISAQRSLAPSIMMVKPVCNTDRTPTRRSNPTPESGGGARGGRKSRLTMHGAEDPVPDDGNGDNTVDGHQLKGGPSCKEKGIALAQLGPEEVHKDEYVVVVIAKAVARS